MSAFRDERRLQPGRDGRVRCHDGLNAALLGDTLRGTVKPQPNALMKEYILKPIMMPTTLSTSATLDKPVVARSVPPRQPLPTAVIDPTRPALKLGLDVHLEFIMAVSQQDHASLKAPRKFTREQLVEQVKQWGAQGLQVFCVQESCGFGFTLHRQLVAAGAQSFQTGSNHEIHERWEHECVCETNG